MRPLLDAFGTRIDPSWLRAQLDGMGLPAVELVVGDGHLTLRVGAPADPGGDPVSRAVTSVRGVFSPMMRCGVEVVDGLPGGPARVNDARSRHHETVALAEVVRPPGGVDEALRGLLDRLGVHGSAVGPARVDAPALPQPDAQARASSLAVSWAHALGQAGVEAGSLTWLENGPHGLLVHGGPGQGTTVHLVAWLRPESAGGGGRGVRAALILAASTSSPALGWLIAALGDPVDGLPDVPVLLDGLQWTAARRPTIAAPPGPSPIVVDPDRCTTCGLCAAVCPTGFLDAAGRPTTAEASACIGCMDCVEACPEDALRPAYGPESATRGELPHLADGWLARLRGAPGPAEPAPFPPSFLLPRRGPSGVEARTTPPRVVLGIAMISQQEHAAALFIDGVLAGALEEEKVVRVRHYGWSPRRGPAWRNLGVDPTIPIEAVLPRRAIRALLAEHGLTLDDVDVFALNGLASRYRRLLPVLDADAPVPVVDTGRVIGVPHHLAHAASAFRMSGLPAAWVLTVDGRGDRETAAIFRADGDGIRQARTLLSLTDRSIGGVYETVTRLLGFGSHGQGSVMALAAMGAPSDAMTPFLSARSWSEVHVHEFGIAEAFRDLARRPDDPLLPAHADLAASLQDALERTLLALVRDAVGDGPVDALCLAGGVALNCKANDLLRTALPAAAVWAQPGANDAGTAVGAAAEAWARLGGGPVPAQETASLGPAFEDEAIQRALDAAGLRWERPDDLEEAVAERLAAGEVVCWFQDRLEFGPRALGARSILADPRNLSLHARVNRMKDREPWRPFGPSVLAGHEGDWFVDAFDSRFMLFTQWVRPEKRAVVPVIVHEDGSTRPQVVHPGTHPRYHKMIAAFHRRTGVPMVVDTSFNRRGEPIVARPEDAIEAFEGLGADWLAIGGFLVRQGDRVVPAPVPVDDAALAALPGGRRLMLRVATACDLTCAHCTMRDHVHHGRDPAADDVVRSLAAGRHAGCDELVLMRGEPLGRPDALRLIERARRMGYRFIQVQTHGRALADARFATALRAAGVSALEVMLLGADAPVHDRLAGLPTGSGASAFRDTVAGLQHAVKLGMDVLVTVPVLRANALHLPRIVALLHKLGVRRVQLQFPRPVETPRGVPTEALMRLAPAAAAAGRAARYAQKLGLSVSTEGFPLCRLEPWLHGTPDATEDFGRHRIDDMGIVHDGFAGVRGRLRPEAPPCRACALAARCPRTWGLYLEMFGSGELITSGPAPSA